MENGALFANVLCDVPILQISFKFATLDGNTANDRMENQLHCLILWVTNVVWGFTSCFLLLSLGRVQWLWSQWSLGSATHCPVGAAHGWV